MKSNKPKRRPVRQLMVAYRWYKKGYTLKEAWRRSQETVQR